MERGNLVRASILADYPYEVQGRVSEGRAAAAALKEGAYCSGSTDLARQRISRVRALATRFLAEFGDQEVELLRAPGRINILGEHVDYVSYLPTASIPCVSEEYDMLMLVAASLKGRVCGHSLLSGMSPFTFSLTDLPTRGSPGEDTEHAWERILAKEGPPPHHWSNYVRGAAAHARVIYQERLRCGIDFVVDSVIPAGGGASSSSALTCLAGYAIRMVNGLSLERTELAMASSKAEWFVGTRGGALDHLSICLAERGKALHLSYDTEPLNPAQRVSQVRLPALPHRWVTFFTHPAEKGSAVLLEYNERAVVSRIVIPALIEGWRKDNPKAFGEWQQAVLALKEDKSGAERRILPLLELLPEGISLKELSSSFPSAFKEAAKVFPALVKERLEDMLKVRARALHHVGEVLRIQRARKILQGGTAGAQHDSRPHLGELLNLTHESLRDNYDVSTPEVEELRTLLASLPSVHGARIMGGGFGGNILALVSEENVATVVQAAEDGFYRPRGRDGVGDGDIRVSSPGSGIGVVSPLPQGDFLRLEVNASIVRIAQLGSPSSGVACSELGSSLSQQGTELLLSARREKERLCELLDGVTELSSISDIQPIIVAAGKGTRACASGLTVPKSVAPIQGVPAITHVFDAVLKACPRAKAPLVIVSDEVREAVVQALGPREFRVVVQEVARGTGDAVLCAREMLLGHQGHSLVVWGTQPVIRPETFRRTLALAALFSDFPMVVPTAFGENPYAPLLRSQTGEVRAAVETHLQKAPSVPYGETNLGLFLLKTESMLRVLGGLKEQFFDPVAGTYRRTGGELGFPNELISAFAEPVPEVLACPLADLRETQGIKCKEDVLRCEEFRVQLEKSLCPEC